MKLSCYMIVCFGLAIACGCQPPRQDSRKPNRLSVLNGTERILIVDRSGKHPLVGDPYSKMQESQYTKDTRGLSYNISFSADGSAVTIMMGSNTVESVGRIDDGEVRTYGLRTFAGGRLVVWPTGTNYEAELTIYGSGLPIISSERGPLVENK